MAFDRPLYHQNTHVNITVLVVDDSLIFLSLFANMLKNPSYKDKSIGEITVMTANDSSEALYTLRGQCNNIHVVITDYHLPGLNGVQLKKRIKEEFGNLPVIVISADMNNEIEQETLSSGALCFIKKPIKPDDLNIVWNHALNYKINGGSKEIQKTNSTSNPYDGDSPPQATKKFKIKWAGSLDNKFNKAIQHIGVHKATPKKILEFMNLNFLTRAHIASKLQKYRKLLKKVNDKSIEKARRGMNSKFTSQHSYNCNTRLRNNKFFNSQPGYGVGQSSSMMNNSAGLHDSLNYMNRRPTTYDLSQTGSNLFPRRGSLGFSNGMLPLKEEWRSISRTSQAPRCGQYGTTSNALGMNSNLTTGTTDSNYAGIRIDENGDLVGFGGTRVNSIGNGSFGGIRVHGGNGSLDGIRVHGNGHGSPGGIREHDYGKGKRVHDTGNGYGSFGGVRVHSTGNDNGSLDEIIGHGSPGGIRVHDNGKGKRVHDTGNDYGSFGGVRVHSTGNDNGSLDEIIVQDNGHGSPSGIRVHDNCKGKRVHDTSNGYGSFGGVRVHSTGNDNGSFDEIIVHDNGHGSPSGIREHDNCKGKRVHDTSNGYGSFGGVRVHSTGNGNGSLDEIIVHGNGKNNDSLGRIKVHGTGTGTGIDIGTDSVGGIRVHGTGSGNGYLGEILGGMNWNFNNNNMRNHGSSTSTFASPLSSFLDNNNNNDSLGGIRLHGTDTGTGSVGGIRVHGTGNSNESLGDNLGGMNWKFNNNNISNYGSSTSTFASASSSFIDNKHQSQNNLIAQTGGVVPALENPSMFNDHHGINEVICDTPNSQFDQNQHQGNVTGVNLEASTAYPLEDICNWNFDDGNNNEEILKSLATNPEMYFPTEDMNITNQEHRVADLTGLPLSFDQDSDDDEDLLKYLLDLDMN